MNGLDEDGTEFIRCIFEMKFPEKSYKKLELYDTSIITLLSSMLDKEKTMSVLIDQNVTSEIELITRSFLEQYFYLSFILEKYTKERGRAYYIHQRYEMYNKVNQSLNGMENKENAKIMCDSIDKKIREDKSPLTSLDEATSNYTEMYNDLFEAAIKRHGSKKVPGTNRKNQMNWYNTAMTGINSLFDLANYLGFADLYRGIYGPLSMNIHGVDAPSKLIVGDVIDTDNNIAHIVLSSGSDPTSNIRMCRSVLMQLIIEVAKYYDILKKDRVQRIVKKYQLNLKYQNL